MVFVNCSARLVPTDSSGVAVRVAGGTSGLICVLLLTRRASDQAHSHDRTHMHARAASDKAQGEGAARRCGPWTNIHRMVEPILSNLPDANIFLLTDRDEGVRVMFSGLMYVL